MFQLALDQKQFKASCTILQGGVSGRLLHGVHTMKRDSETNSRDSLSKKSVHGGLSTSKAPEILVNRSDQTKCAAQGRV